MKVGIIGAMDVEVEEIINNMAEKKTEDVGHLHFVEGFIDKTPVVIVQSGVGKVNAGICAQTLILKYNVTCVINTGIAGGIAQELSVMDMTAITLCQENKIPGTSLTIKLSLNM